MATVLKIDGYLIQIFSRDHLPRHVHVFKGGGECVINLVGENDYPELREFYGLKRKELAKAIKLVVKHQEELLDAWNKIHGE
jgi:hypothetical protein